MQSLHIGCGNSFPGAPISISLNEIIPRRLEMRSSLGDLEDLKQSIANAGLLNPILVRSIGPSRYEVVVGNRRLRAFQSLGYEEIPAKIVDANDKECLELFLVENIQRETLNPLDEARAFYSYVCSAKKDGFGYGSIADLARRISKSQEYISNRIRILRLPNSLLRQLLGEDKLTISHVEELASISDKPEVVKELAYLVTSHRISVRILEKTIHFIKSGVEIARALELAKIESDFGLEMKASEDYPSRVSEMMFRTKKILESTLSYLDNALPDLEGTPAIKKYWLENVRAPVHKAIDGAIVCQKRLSRNNVANPSPQWQEK